MMKYHRSLPTTFTLLVYLLLAATSDGATLLRLGRTLNTCPAVGANRAITNLNALSTDADDCSTRLGIAEDAAGQAVVYYEKRIEISEVGNTIIKAMDAVDTIVKKASTIINAIPKFGAIINRVNKALQLTFKPVMEQVAGDITDLKKTKARFEHMEMLFEKMSKKADQTVIAADTTSDIFQHALDISSAANCCKVEAINRFGNLVSSTPHFELATTTFAQCAVSFELPSLDFDTPDIGFLADITPPIDAITAWITETTDAILEQIGVDVCCNPRLSFITGFLEVVSQLVSLATCAIDGAAQGAINEGLDVLIPLIQPMADVVNDVLGGHNAFIDGVNQDMNQFNNFPYFGVDPSTATQLLASTTCFDVSVGLLNLSMFDFDFQPVEFNKIPNVAGIDLGQADNEFNLDAIGQEIKVACKDALDAFKDTEDTDCCAVAREDAGIPILGWKIGHRCSYDEECESEVCYGDSPATRVCSAQPKIGEECGTHEHCRKGITGGHCEVIKVIDGGSVCYPASKKAPLGQPCGVDHNCNTNAYCSIAEHVFDTTRLNFRKCVRAEVGSECNLTGGGDCEKGIPGGKCEVIKVGVGGSICYPSDKKAPAGTPCGNNGNCDAGTFCSDDEVDFPDHIMNFKVCTTKGEFQTSCRTDSQCKDDLNCAGGKCLHGNHGDICESQSDCKVSNYCNGGKCYDGRVGSRCGINGDCDKNHCYNNLCTAGLHGDGCGQQADCESGNYCNSSKCYDGRLGSRCGINGNCDSRHCVSRSCTSGQHGQPCGTQSDCHSSLYCNRGKCYDGRKGDRCSIHRDCRNSCPPRTKTCN